MLFMARVVYGAALATGIEVMPERQHPVFRFVLEALGYHPNTVSAAFGRGIAGFTKLPSNQAAAASMQTAVYMLCDGWSKDDTKNAFKKIAQDPSVRVFTCTGHLGGKGDSGGSGDLCATEVLACLNKAATACSGMLSVFHIEDSVPIVMWGNGQQRSMLVFSRRYS